MKEEGREIKKEKSERKRERGERERSRNGDSRREIISKGRQREKLAFKQT